MVKGCQRQIVLLRGTGSELFEEAYFILKPEKTSLPPARMITEANRIIEENTLRGKRQVNLRSRRHGERLLFFLLGLLSGSTFLGILWLFWG
ncbi:MAG: hypothetical protein E7654_01860 [Ruminococcaceae bacterium]|nr:hypothetical protein [Oscillospiraceae bacterium]